MNGLLQAKVAKPNRQLLVDEELETLTEKIREMWDQRQPKPNGGREARVIGETKLVGYLNQGWELVTELKDGHIVVKVREISLT